VNANATEKGAIIQVSLKDLTAGKTEEAKHASAFQDHRKAAGGQTGRVET
jgi:hypothetical protein